MSKPCKKIVNGLKKCVSFNHRIHYSVMPGLLILILLSLFISESLSAKRQGKIVILNSDMSISKYYLAHAEFKSKITNLEAEVDLGSKWIDEKGIKKMIRKIDPDIIYCVGSYAYQTAYKFARKKNLVFSLVINWRRLPMGKNTYGISNELYQGMQLMMYRYFFPDVNNIGVVYNKVYNKEWFDTAVKSAKEVGIKIIGWPISEPDEVESALNKLLPKVDALWLTPDPTVIHDIESVKKIFKRSEATRKPVFAYNKAFTNYGATLIVSADIGTMGRQAAGLVFNILADQKVTERVQNPAGSHITLNMKKIEEYGLNLNVEALDSVNEIIK